MLVVISSFTTMYVWQPILVPNIFGVTKTPGSFFLAQLHPHQDSHLKPCLGKTEIALLFFLST